MFYKSAEIDLLKFKEKSKQVDENSRQLIELHKGLDNERRQRMEMQSQISVFIKKRQQNEI